MCLISSLPFNSISILIAEFHFVVLAKQVVHPNFTISSGLHRKTDDASASIHALVDSDHTKAA